MGKGVPAVSNFEPIAPLCVYTIAHTERLNFFYNLGGHGELIEGKRWTRAAVLMRAAREFHMRFLVLFAAAEESTELIFHATLEEIRLRGERHGQGATTFSFSGLAPFREPRPLKISLVNDHTGRPVPHSFKRPYLICRTPLLLLAAPRTV
jgi:hypothetical protein